MMQLNLKRRLKTFAITAFAVVALGLLSPVLTSQHGLTDFQSTLVTSVYAQDDTGGGLAIPTGDVKISSSIAQDRSFAENVTTMVNYFIGFLGFLATIAFVYAGILWVLSGGSEEMITKAKKIMIYAGLGLIVVMLSYSVVGFITSSVPSDATTTPGVEECQNDDDCNDGLICVPYGFGNVCTTKGPGDYCESNDDCDSGQECNTIRNRCVRLDLGGSTGGPAEPVVNQNFDSIDDLMSGLDDLLDIGDIEIGTAMSSVTGDADEKINEMISNIEQIIESGEDAEGKELTATAVRELEGLVEGLERLGDLNEQLDLLNENMPQCNNMNEAWDEASDALDKLIDEPTEDFLFNRFNRDYKKLKELVLRYPVVQVRTRATPGEGNVPFSVQFDGLDSIDPTGGTVGDYQWTYLDSSGREIFVGSDPVVIHEFTESNTYAVRLRASTTQFDDVNQCKTAMDGVSVVRVRANPPTSQIEFRINGVEAFDIFHVTLDEAQAGLAFDPTLTVPALGRTITRYHWSFGDKAEEVRQAPTTVIHAYPDAGEYFVKLEVIDNLGVKDKRIVKLFVKSLAADIRVNPKQGTVNTEFSFTGIGSRSDDGLIEAFEWEIQDTLGNIVKDSSENRFTHRFDQPGTYTVTLLISDINGAKDRVIKEIEVLSRSPIANFDYMISAVNHPNRIEFNGISSYDPDEGDLITYSWDFDGDGDFELTDSKDAIAIHEYNRIGEYRVRLQVQDAFGKRDLVEKSVAIDSLISADILTDRLATRVGEPIELTVDSPNAVSFLWEFGDGETESTEEITVTHIYSKAGKFVLKLHFFDKNDNENIAEKRILVGAGEEPLAVIDHTVNGREPHVIEYLCGEKTDGTLVTRSDLIRFNARHSINTDGSSRLLSYDWRFSNGEKSNNKETSFKFDEVSREGECFSISLAVRDQLSGKLSQPQEEYFKVINRIPQITDFVITAPADDLITPIKIKLEAVNPRDTDGTIKKYKWWYYLESFENNRFGVHSTSTPKTDITITSFGEPDIVNRYFFVLEVTDSDNGIYTSEERFSEVSYLEIKNGPNLSPVAEFTLDKTTISVGDSITFISRSYDPQGETLPNGAFRWDFDGDGAFDDVSTGPQVNRQFNTPGEYEVRLKVVYRGLSSSTRKVIFVEATESLPQAAFTYKVDDNTVTFNATNTRYDPTLEDTTLRFEWDYDINSDQNGNGINDDDVESTEVEPTFTYPEKGVYTVRLKVKDITGMEGVVVRDVDLNITEEERLKNAYHSLSVEAPDHPLTALDLSVIPAVLKKGDSADVEVTILNADGTEYTGEVFFEILDGSGGFTPNPVTARDSKAMSIFKVIDAGKVRIRIRATGTIYGDISEEATITVRN